MKAATYSNPKSNEFSSDLMQQLDSGEPILRLATEIRWEMLEKELLEGYYVDILAKSIRLMVGLLIIRKLFNHSYANVVQECKRSPYTQKFCGFKTFQVKAPCAGDELKEFRRRIGENGRALIFEELNKAIGNMDATNQRELVNSAIDSKESIKNASLKRNKKKHRRSYSKLVTTYEGCRDRDFEADFHKLADARSPFCLGIDPSTQVLQHWGFEDNPKGLHGFCAKLIKTLASNKLAVVKPQVAYFERFGSYGIDILQELIGTIRSNKTLVILDAKRGDIGATNIAYAQGFFANEYGYAVDAVTLSPFLGVAALEPIFAIAKEHKAYVFVVVASSNPEGRQWQQARMATGNSVSFELSEAILEYNNSSSPSVCGAVIGAIRDDLEAQLLPNLANSLILSPGIGAQGGGYKNLAKFPQPRNLIPVAARSVLLAAPQAISGVLAEQCNQAMLLRQSK